MPQKPLPRSIHLTHLPAAPTSPVLTPRNPMSPPELSLCPSIVSQWPLLCLHPSAPHSHLPLFTPTSTQTRRLVHTSIHFATQLLATSRTCIFTCMNWLASPQPEADSSQPPAPLLLYRPPAPRLLCISLRLCSLPCVHVTMPKQAHIQGIISVRSQESSWGHFPLLY